MTGSKVNESVSAQAKTEWDTLLRTAYEGEIIGEAMYVSLERLASTDGQRHAARLLTQIEKETADILVPIMLRHNIGFDRKTAWQQGEDFTKKSMGEGWTAYFEKVVPLAEAAYKGMKRLQKMSDEIDRAAIGRLVAHEEAFLEFARREVAGSPDSVVPLERYLNDLR